MSDAGHHGKLAHALASYLRPAALAEFDKAVAAVFVAGAEVSPSSLLALCIVSIACVAKAEAS